MTSYHRYWHFSFHALAHRPDGANDDLHRKDWLLTTEALETLYARLADVTNLIDYHPGAGRPAKDAQPLLRSCVVLTYAAWEVYVEDSLVWAADRLAEANSFANLPAALQTFVASSVKSAGDLADNGWREELRRAVTRKVRGDEESPTDWGLNTAGPKQIAKLHETVLGTNLLNSCSWQRKSNSSGKKDLASLVRVRGSIVHTGSSPGEINLPGARGWSEFVHRLARALDTRFEDWIETRMVP